MEISGTPTRPLICSEAFRRLTVRGSTVSIAMNEAICGGGECLYAAILICLNRFRVSTTVLGSCHLNVYVLYQYLN